MKQTIKYENPTSKNTTENRVKKCVNHKKKEKLVMYVNKKNFTEFSTNFTVFLCVVVRQQVLHQTLNPCYF